MSPRRPSIMVMAVGLLKTSADTIMSGALGNNILATEQLAKTRQSICENCEFLMENSRCAKCGCFVLAKVKIEISKCPIGNW